MTNERLSKVEGDGTYVYDVAEGARQVDAAAHNLWEQLVDKTVDALTLKPGDTLVLRLPPDTEEATFHELYEAVNDFERRSGVKVLLVAVDGIAKVEGDR